MKKLLLATALMAAAPSIATAGINFGVKAGAQKLEVEGFEVPAIAVSGQVAYEILDLTAVALAAELEMSKSISNGKFESKAELSTQTVGAYVSARSIGPLYAIGRLGVAKVDTEVETPIGSSSFSDTGVSMGVGAGFSLGARTEIELTNYKVKGNGDSAKDMYYLTVGLGF